MAAGLSSKQIYGRIRRMQLKNCKRLENEGVPFEFKKNQIHLFDKNDVGGGFNIRYETSYASNGECCITCVVTVHPSRRTPPEECKNLREVYRFPHTEEGFSRIRRWYGTLTQVCELQHGDYFIGQSKAKVAFLYEVENGKNRFTRLHDGAYVERFFTNSSGSIEHNTGFVYRITREQAVEAVNEYRRAA